jgi:hypothetical protein
MQLFWFFISAGLPLLGLALMLVAFVMVPKRGEDSTENEYDTRTIIIAISLPLWFLLTIGLHFKHHLLTASGSCIFAVVNDSTVHVLPCFIYFLFLTIYVGASLNSEGWNQVRG